MNIELHKTNRQTQGEIIITGSKSETNRLLLLQALFPQIEVQNVSNSDDATLMAAGLKTMSGTVDIHHAGTAMRFLTTFFASQQGAEVVLTGSERMQHRPIKILVEALQSLGADIRYLKSEGYPPIEIKGKQLQKNQVTIPANISSQYVSSLMLNAAKMPNGLEIHMEGEITSIPYIQMTVSLMRELGIDAQFEGQKIHVPFQQEVPATKLVVESDWSSASYYYSIIALSDVGSKVTLSAYKKDSLQGDSVLQDIYTALGVETTFEEHQITLKKVAEPKVDTLELHLINAPDIAQTLAVTCFGLGLPCILTGLHTLKIKETDRLMALDIELKKLGAEIRTTLDSLFLTARTMPIRSAVEIETYHDHRMAMAFAPLAIVAPIVILEADVVTKSYPDFWKDLQQIGFELKVIS